MIIGKTQCHKTNLKEKSYVKSEDGHSRIIKIIKTIEASHPDLKIIYTEGACYEFYKILKSIFPKAKAYYNYNASHVITKIGKRYYDINGEVTTIEGYVPVSKDEEHFCKKFIRQFTEYSDSIFSRSNSHRLLINFVDDTYIYDKELFERQDKVFKSLYDTMDI